jgi:hypothetical protein
MGHTRVEKLLVLISLEIEGCCVFSAELGKYGAEKICFDAGSIVVLRSSLIKLDGYEGKM